jgi:hypothetical protein
MVPLLLAPWLMGVRAMRRSGFSRDVHERIADESAPTVVA